MIQLRRDNQQLSQDTISNTTNAKYKAANLDVSELSTLWTVVSTNSEASPSFVRRIWLLT
jgi:hypothetical protein